MALATVVLDGGQPCLGEQSQMFAHRGPADRVPCREVDHSGRAGGECAQQITAYGVGQGDERVHPLFVTHRLPIGKSSTPRLRDSPNEEATSRRGHFLTRPSVIATMSATRPPTGAARAPATSQANTGRPPNAKDLSRQVGGTRATARWDSRHRAHRSRPSRRTTVTSRLIADSPGYALLFDRAEPVQASHPAAETRRGFRLANLLLELMS